MALNLSTAGIVDGQVITAAQITQSIDALTGAEAYDITISGSFTMGLNTTGSGTYNRSLRAASVEISSLGVDNYYTIPYLSSTGSSTALIRYSGTSPSYNPVTETFKATNFLGTASFCASSSLAQTASYIDPSSIVPSKLAPSYLYISNATYPPATPYTVNGTTQTNIYISASAVIGLQFSPTSVTDGQIVNFNPFYLFPNLQSSNIAISASVNVYGIGDLGTGNSIVSPGNPKTLDQIGVGPTIKSFTFQYIATPGINFPTVGWYLINVNEN
jgi:hypothetical protein